MKTTGLSNTVLAILLAGFTPAMAKPNFTGEWKMVPSKSDYGAMDAPASSTRKIDHQEPNIHMVATQKGARGELTQDFKYATDGKEYVNTSRLGEARSVLKWDGDTLVVSTKRTVMGRDIQVVDRWSLSPDGKTMTVEGKITGGMGENEYKVILEKQ